MIAGVGVRRGQGGSGASVTEVPAARRDRAVLIRAPVGEGAAEVGTLVGKGGRRRRVRGAVAVATRRDQSNAGHQGKDTRRAHSVGSRPQDEGSCCRERVMVRDSTRCPREPEPCQPGGVRFDDRPWAAKIRPHNDLVERPPELDSAAMAPQVLQDHHTGQRDAGICVPAARDGAPPRKSLSGSRLTRARGPNYFCGL